MEQPGKQPRRAVTLGTLIALAGLAATAITILVGIKTLTSPRDNRVPAVVASPIPTQTATPTPTEPPPNFVVATSPTGRCKADYGCDLSVTLRNTGGYGNAIANFTVDDDSSHELAKCSVATSDTRTGDSVTATCTADDGGLEQSLHRPWHLWWHVHVTNT
jgi:hypothetical protein